ncbi:hypothetical protein AF335_09080 [Streptomyces eurocidicus]|uniref:DUF4352 domain-containing protein n=1 Tax=Streptomyces eurocidicus TaxID=66423 RepID=A0A2N8P0X5_STREU|nr:DUF4352 domain-containing protein [Streptomyces eurocidicus]MBB5121795.1 hypothetical protein [Streptomyces eurocidicus]PNE34670.1 hypothetical protein AF335_09080 [Streptomyces eurocidicus]
MRRQFTVAAAVIALAATATACDNGTEDTGGRPSGSAPAGQHSSAPAPAASSAAPGKGSGGGHAVGATFTLKGKKAGSQVAVTLKKWADPAHSSNKYLQPSAGKRWVAAQFELVNTGTTGYEDSPSNGAKVLDAQGQVFTQSIGRISEGPSIPATVNLAAGQKATGWVVFSVPENTKPASVRFALDSGFAKDTGEWTLSK